VGDYLTTRHAPRASRRFVPSPRWVENINPTQMQGNRVKRGKGKGGGMPLMGITWRFRSSKIKRQINTDYTD